MQTQSRVFITHRGGALSPRSKRLDLTPAERYGELVTVFSTELFPDEVDDKMPDMVQHARGVLASFDLERDYLCLVGSPVSVAVCMYILGQASLTDGPPYSVLRLLRYDRQEQAYYVVPVR